MRDAAAALLGLGCHTRTHTHTHTPLLSQSNSNESYACKRAESSNVIGVPMGPKEEEGGVSREWGLGQSCCGYGCAAVVVMAVAVQAVLLLMHRVPNDADPDHGTNKAR